MIYIKSVLFKFSEYSIRENAIFYDVLQHVYYIHKGFSKKLLHFMDYAFSSKYDKKWSHWLQLV